MQTLELLVPLVVMVGWMVSLSLHEFGHAIVAYWGGDRSVKEKGYLTLNPFKYTDLTMSVVLPVVFLLLGGIGLPGGAVYIQIEQIRGRLWKSAMSAAGPLMNLVGVGLLAIPFEMGWLPGDIQDISHQADLTPTDFQTQWLIASGLAFLLVLDIYSALLNLLPIPALDGYGVVEPWLPAKVRTQLHPYKRSGIGLLFLALLLVPSFNRGLWDISTQIAGHLGVSPVLYFQGYGLFREKALWIALLVLPVLALGRSLLTSVRSPRDVLANAWNTIGQICEYFKRPKSALAWYERAFKVQPNPHLGIWLNRIQSLNQLERFESAIALCEQGIERNATIGSRSQFAEVWVQKANALRALEQPETALEAYEQASQLQPENAWLWLMQGWMLATLNQPDVAISAYDRAIELQPDYGNAWAMKAELLHDLGQLEAAEPVYASAMQYLPGNGTLGYRWGTLLEALDRPEAAIAQYRQAIRRDPRLLEAWRSLAWALIAARQYERVIQLGRKSSPFAEDLMLLNAEAIALGRLGQSEEAIARFEQAMRLYPEEGLSWYNQACLAAEQGDSDRAIALLDEAFRRSPDLKQQFATDTSFEELRRDERLRSEWE